MWFYDLQTDGFSLDDKRTPISDNDLPDLIAKWKDWQDDVQGRTNPANVGASFRDKTQQAFLVDKSEIADNKYDLSINRYKEVVYEEEQYDPPKEILQRLMDLEAEIQVELKELGGML